MWPLAPVQSLNDVDENELSEKIVKTLFMAYFQLMEDHERCARVFQNKKSSRAAVIKAVIKTLRPSLAINDLCYVLVRDGSYKVLSPSMQYHMAKAWLAVTAMMDFLQKQYEEPPEKWVDLCNMLRRMARLQTRLKIGLDLPT